MEIDCGAKKVLPRFPNPVIELAAMRSQTIKKRPSIAGKRLVPVGGVVAFLPPANGDDIDTYSGCIQPQFVPIGVQNVGEIAKVSAQAMQTQSKIAAGMCVVHVTPKKGGNAFAW
ncbi:hypothetical protein GCM10007881_27910 [Mesorhizobium huakuii]|nr:hypothetical protein GCM10007881_27910 [Mesorhizobium huakuii]